MSSYEKYDYASLFKGLVALYNPSTIVEFGILDGYSLSAFRDAAPVGCEIKAFDIFDEFPYNHAKFEDLRIKFGNIVRYGNFYETYKNLKDQSIDLLHIDIANDGDVYEFFFRSYARKLTPNGLAILEGGSLERDRYDWMLKYNKAPIVPVIDKYRCDFNIFVVPMFPSITLVSHKRT